MKVIIYFILIIAFLMFYQKNPVFAILLLILSMGIYLFLKTRKSKRSASSGSLITSFHGSQPKYSDDFLRLMLLKHMFSSGNASQDQNATTSPFVNKHQQKIEKIKQEVLELLKS